MTEVGGTYLLIAITTSTSKDKDWHGHIEPLIDANAEMVGGAMPQAPRYWHSHPHDASHPEVMEHHA